MTHFRLQVSKVLFSLNSIRVTLLKKWIPCQMKQYHINWVGVVLFTQQFVNISILGILVGLWYLVLLNCIICFKITNYYVCISHSVVDDVIQLSSSNLNCAFSNPVGYKTYCLLNCALMAYFTWTHCRLICGK